MPPGLTGRVNVRDLSLAHGGGGRVGGAAGKRGNVGSCVLSNDQPMPEMDQQHNLVANQLSQTIVRYPTSPQIN